MIAHEVTKDGFMETQVHRVRAYYQRQRDLMLGALDAHMTAGMQWTKPADGMFLWCTLAEGVNATELAYEAVKQGVAYVPGETFFTGGTGLNTLRLSYSVATPEEIETGVSRLGQVFERAAVIHRR